MVRNQSDEWKNDIWGKTRGETLLQDPQLVCHTCTVSSCTSFMELHTVSPTPPPKVSSSQAKIRWKVWGSKHRSPYLLRWLRHLFRVFSKLSRVCEALTSETRHVKLDRCNFNLICLSFPLMKIFLCLFCRTKWIQTTFWSMFHLWKLYLRW